MTMPGRSRARFRARLALLVMVLGLVMGVHAIVPAHARAERVLCTDDPAQCEDGSGQGDGGGGDTGAGDTGSEDTGSGDTGSGDDTGSGMGATVDTTDPFPPEDQPSGPDAISGADSRTVPFSFCGAEYLAYARAPKGTETETLAATAYDACIHQVQGTAITGRIDPPGGPGPIGAAAPTVAARQAARRAPARHAPSHRKASHKRHATKRRG